MLICVSVPRRLLPAPSCFTRVLPGPEPWECGPAGTGVLACLQGELSSPLAARSDSFAKNTDVWHTGRKGGSTKLCSVQC